MKRKIEHKNTKIINTKRTELRGLLGNDKPCPSFKLHHYLALEKFFKKHPDFITEIYAGWQLELLTGDMKYLKAHRTKKDRAQRSALIYAIMAGNGGTALEGLVNMESLSEFEQRMFDPATAWIRTAWIYQNKAAFLWMLRNLPAIVATRLHLYSAPNNLSTLMEDKPWEEGVKILEEPEFQKIVVKSNTRNFYLLYKSSKIRDLYKQNGVALFELTNKYTSIALILKSVDAFLARDGELKSVWCKEYLLDFFKQDLGSGETLMHYAVNEQCKNIFRYLVKDEPSLLALKDSTGCSVAGAVWSLNYEPYTSFEERHAFFNLLFSFAKDTSTLEGVDYYTTPESSADDTNESYINEIITQLNAIAFDNFTLQSLKVTPRTLHYIEENYQDCTVKPLYHHYLARNQFAKIYPKLLVLVGSIHDKTCDFSAFLGFNIMDIIVNKLLALHTPSLSCISECNRSKALENWGKASNEGNNQNRFFFSESSDDGETNFNSRSLM